jgi:hypothetical protein
MDLNESSGDDNEDDNFQLPADSASQGETVKGKLDPF